MSLLYRVPTWSMAIYNDYDIFSSLDLFDELLVFEITADLSTTITAVGVVWFTGVKIQ